MTEQQTKTTKKEDNTELNNAGTERRLFRSKSKQAKVQATTVAETPQKPRKWVQIRLIPIWLRILLVLLLLAGTMILGAIFGYSVLGDGEALHIFRKETWAHIVDIMTGKGA